MSRYLGKKNLKKTRTGKRGSISIKLTYGNLEKANKYWRKKGVMYFYKKLINKKWYKDNKKALSKRESKCNCVIITITK